MARIVQVCPRYLPAWGGAEAFFAKFGEALARRGDDVSVWTTDSATVRALTTPDGARLPPGPERIHGVEVRRFPVLYLPAQRWIRTAAHWLPFGERWRCDTLRWTPFVPAMTTEATRRPEQIDVVHAAGLPYSSVLFAGLRLAERAGARLIMTPFTHVAPPGAAGARMRRAYLSALNLRLLAKADRVFVQTAREAQILADSGLTASRQTVVGLGVDPDETTGGNRAAVRSAWGVESDAVVVGHLANKSWDKGTVDLLEAAERLWANGRTFRLVLAGQEMPSFARRWAQSQFRDRVINLPALSERERRDFFAGLDIYALPSYVESFGLSPLEAAVNGAAVLVYDHGGPGEIFCNDITARLVPVGDLAALAASLDGLICGPSLRARLAQAGRQAALEHSWPRVLGVAIDACDELIGRGPRPRRRGVASTIA
jgi:glycosyltransferase involved in cell wall biosynthesis